MSMVARKVHGKLAFVPGLGVEGTFSERTAADCTVGAILGQLSNEGNAEELGRGRYRAV